MIALLAVSCGGRGPVILPTATPPPTFTPGPTPIPARPTDPPPGSAENPLSLYLVAPGSPSRYADEVDTLGDALVSATGLVVEVQVTDSYAVVLEGLCNRTIHIGTLDAFGYLAASQQGCATPAFVVERDGETTVQGQLIANSQTLIANVESFRGRRFCRPSSDSAYGWIMPSVALRARGIDPLNELNTVIDAGSNEEVVQLVHDLECDVGATLLGAEEAVDDLDRPEFVSFIEALTPIPNDAIVFSSAVNEPVREASLEALEMGETALLDVMSADGLKTARDSDYDEMRDLFASAGIDVLSLSR